MAKRKNPEKTKIKKTKAPKSPKIPHAHSHWLHSIINVLFKPRQFFQTLIVDGSLDAPIIKAAVWGLIGGMLSLTLGLIHNIPTTFGLVLSDIILTPVIAVMILFALGGIMMLVAEITKGDRDFEVGIKGIASIFFLYPVLLALYALAFNCTSIWIISLLTDAYILFLLYNVATYCLRGKKISVKLVMACFAVLLITIYATDYRIAWFLLKNTSATLSCLY
jgi:hypothetical protein